MRQRAFTLIELLVVIAIITILAGLLFPVFSQAKATAKQAVCITHMRQIGMAMMMYKIDHSDRWVPSTYSSQYKPGFSIQQPWIGYDNNNGNVGPGLTGQSNRPAVNDIRPGLIDPYMKSEKIKPCPSQPDQWQLAIAYNWFSTEKPSAYYTTNPRAEGREYGPGVRFQYTDEHGLLSAIAANDGEIHEPSNTLVLWEHDARVPLCNFLQPHDWFDSPPHDDDLHEHFNFLHRGGTTTLWADGHTKRMMYTQLRRPMFSVDKSIYDD